MIDLYMIPDEVVEAAARVLHAHAEVFHDVLWDDLGDYDQEAYREEARAAIAAGLAAWPGGDYRPGAKVTKTWRDPGKIILPLPQEKSDD